MDFKIKYRYTTKDGVKYYDFTFWGKHLSNYQKKKRIRDFIEKKRGVVVRSMKCSNNTPHIRVETNIDNRLYALYYLWK